MLSLDMARTRLPSDRRVAKHIAQHGVSIILPAFAPAQPPPRPARPPVDPLGKKPPPKWARQQQLAQRLTGAHRHVVHLPAHLAADYVQARFDPLLGADVAGYQAAKAIQTALIARTKAFNNTSASAPTPAPDHVPDDAAPPLPLIRDACLLPGLMADGRMCFEAAALLVEVGRAIQRPVSVLYSLPELGTYQADDPVPMSAAMKRAQLAPVPAVLEDLTYVYDLSRPYTGDDTRRALAPTRLSEILSSEPAQLVLTQCITPRAWAALAWGNPTPGDPWLMPAAPYRDSGGTDYVSAARAVCARVLDEKTPTPTPDALTFSQYLRATYHFLQTCQDLAQLVQK